jgi:hypothetical protein
MLRARPCTSRLALSSKKNSCVAQTRLRPRAIPRFASRAPTPPHLTLCAPAPHASHGCTRPPSCHVYPAPRAAHPAHASRRPCPRLTPRPSALRHALPTPHAALLHAASTSLHWTAASRCRVRSPTPHAAFLMYVAYVSSGYCKSRSGVVYVTMAIHVFCKCTFQMF